MAKCYWMSGVATSAITVLGLAVLPTSAQAVDDTVRFATASWPGSTVKSEVARQILASLGYVTDLTEASPALIFEGMARGDLDINMGFWRPSQSSQVEPRLDSGELTEVVRNIEGARFKLAVPAYVWNAGIHSMTDLDRHAGAFDRTLYGIEAGNVGNEIMQEAINNDLYGLGGWQVQVSSVPGMLSAVKNARSNGDWIAFLAWEPHWMNVIYDVRYLEDPEGIWGESSTVSTLASTAFIETHPNVLRFLEQMVVPIEVQNDWIYDFGHEERPLKQVAGDWIDSHPELVGQWLEGVTQADGSPRTESP